MESTSKPHKWGTFVLPTIPLWTPYASVGVIPIFIMHPKGVSPKETKLLNK